MACRKEPLERVCEGCGKTYTTSISHRKTSRFCSKSCAKTGEHHHFYGKEGPTKGQSTWIKGLTKNSDSRVAAMAEKVSAIHKQQFRDGTRSNRGALNPNWKSPEKRKTYLNHALRQTDKYVKWRFAVFQRDNFRCTKCGDTTKAFNADHIKRFADLLTIHNITTIEEGLECSELWNLENGQTLCVDCHRKTETYGSRKPKSTVSSI